MLIYMKYGDIVGGVTADTHKGWVELKSFKWGLGRSISTHSGFMSDRDSSSISISEITVTKAADAASPKLLNEALGSKEGKTKGKEVKIDFCITDKEILTTYTLTNCLISGFKIDGGGGDRASETLSLNFTMIEYSNTPEKPTGEADAPDRVTFDLTKGKVV